MTCLTMLAAATANAAPPVSPDAIASAPAAVVREFNSALSVRNLDAALATLEPGAVNFNFGSSHSFSAAPGGVEPLTSDLAVRWRTVAPVLYAANRRYVREIEELTTHVDGALAVVWARMRTTAESTADGTTTRAFAETYVLRLDKDQWRIAGIASSRGTQ